MSTLSRRGPYANESAKLPGLQALRADDPQTQKAIEALREWIEVRLGSRGDKFERAVTFRDLEQQLETFRATLDARPQTAQLRGGSSTFLDLGPISSELASLRDAVALLQARSENSGLSDQLVALAARLSTLASALTQTQQNTIDALQARQNTFTRAQLVSQSLGTIVLDPVDSVYKLVFDGSQSTSFFALLTASCRVLLPAAVRAGNTYTFVFKQNSAGGHLPTFTASYDFGNAPVFPTAPGDIFVVRAVAIDENLPGFTQPRMLCTLTAAYSSFTRRAASITGRSVVAGAGRWTASAAGSVVSSSVVTGAS